MSWPPSPSLEQVEARFNKLSRTPAVVWAEVFDKLFWYLNTVSTYYPEKFPPGEWYEKFVTDEQKEVLKHLNASNLVLPAPLWKLFGGNDWEVFHRSINDDGQIKSFGRPTCGSCRKNLNGTRDCLQQCNPSKAHLCPFHSAFNLEDHRHYSTLKVL